MFALIVMLGSLGAATAFETEIKPIEPDPGHSGVGSCHGPDCFRPVFSALSPYWFSGI